MVLNIGSIALSIYWKAEKMLTKSTCDSEINPRNQSQNQDVTMLPLLIHKIESKRIITVAKRSPVNSRSMFVVKHYLKATLPDYNIFLDYCVGFGFDGFRFGQLLGDPQSLICPETELKDTQTTIMRIASYQQHSRVCREGPHQYTCTTRIQHID